MVAEDVLETLGNDQRTREEDADQLIYDVLIEPTEHMDLPVTTTERNAMRFDEWDSLARSVLKSTYVGEWLSCGNDGLKLKVLSIPDVYRERRHGFES